MISNRSKKFDPIDSGYIEIFKSCYAHVRASAASRPKLDITGGIAVDNLVEGDDERTGSRPYAVVRRSTPEQTAAHFSSLMIEFNVIWAKTGRRTKINRSDDHLEWLFDYTVDGNVNMLLNVAS